MVRGPGPGLGRSTGYSPGAELGLAGGLGLARELGREPERTCAACAQRERDPIDGRKLVGRHDLDRLRVDVEQLDPYRLLLGLERLLRGLERLERGPLGLERDDLDREHVGLIASCVGRQHGERQRRRLELQRRAGCREQFIKRRVTPPHARRGRAPAPAGRAPA